jgi:hypothetical protein
VFDRWTLQIATSNMRFCHYLREFYHSVVCPTMPFIGDSGRIVGNPYLIALRQSCPSLGKIKGMIDRHVSRPARDRQFSS